MLEFNPKFEPEFEIPKPEPFQLDMIEDLLRTSTIPMEENEHISKSLNSINYTDAEKLIYYLQAKQVNRILAGLNYNMNYIKLFMKDSI